MSPPHPIGTQGLLLSEGLFPCHMPPPGVGGLLGTGLGLTCCPVLRTTAPRGGVVTGGGHRGLAHGTPF